MNKAINKIIAVFSLVAFVSIFSLGTAFAGKNPAPTGRKAPSAPGKLKLEQAPGAPKHVVPKHSGIPGF